MEYYNDKYQRILDDNEYVIDLEDTRDLEQIVKDLGLMVIEECAGQQILFDKNNYLEE